MASLASKVFAVTGGASGMGLETCRKLARLSSKAICIGDFNARSFDEVESELKKINPSTVIKTTKLNVTSSTEVQAWIADIIKQFGALDGAVNAAGVPQLVQERKRDGSAIVGETDETWARIMGVNLNGVFFSCREEIRAMCELARSPRSIVNISSLASYLHSPGNFSYGVSKAGVSYLTKCIAGDVGPIGIRVNCVSPGLTRMPMLNQFFAGAGEGALSAGGFDIVDPSEIADAIIWLLSEESSKVNGADLPVGPGAP